MRAILLVLILVVLAAVAAIATGFLDINQTRSAKAPQVSTTENGVVSRGGQTPAFDVETGSVKVGVQETTVKVPAVQVEPANGNMAGNAN
jgi:hypothetical protein